MSRRWIAAVALGVAACGSSSAPRDTDTKHRFHSARLSDGEQRRPLREQDRAEIQAALNEHAAALMDCYERRRNVVPQLAGTVQATFLIQPDGNTREITATGLDAEVDACIARVIDTIRFERREGIWEGLTEVNIPFTFPPAATP